MNKFSRLGSALSVFGASRFDSFSTFDFVHLGSSLALRSFGRMGSGLSIYDFLHIGSSLALRSFGRTGSSLSCLGLGRCAPAVWPFLLLLFEQFECTADFDNDLFR